MAGTAMAGAMCLPRTRGFTGCAELVAGGDVRVFPARGGSPGGDGSQHASAMGVFPVRGGSPLAHRSGSRQNVSSPFAGVHRLVHTSGSR